MRGKLLIVLIAWAAAASPAAQAPAVQPPDAFFAFLRKAFPALSHILEHGPVLITNSGLGEQPALLGVPVVFRCLFHAGSLAPIFAEGHTAVPN